MNDVSWPPKLLDRSAGARQAMMIANILRRPVTNFPSGCPVAAQQRADLMGSMAIVK